MTLILKIACTALLWAIHPILGVLALLDTIAWALDEYNL